MQATLYNNHSAPNVVKKSLTAIATVDVELTDRFSIAGGTVRMRRNDAYLSCNYIEIPSLSRKYYCDVTIENGAFMLLDLRSDPLSSFYDSYKSSPCIAYRSTNKPSVFLEDEKVAKRARPTIIYRKIGQVYTPSNVNNYVLTLSGK